MLHLSILKLGDHNLNKRVWIANQAILRAGFKVGELVNILHDTQKNKITIKRSEHGVHKISGRSETSPVIDIKNKKVAETLGKEVTKIEVAFYENKICITVAKKELSKKERLKKTGKKFFELFSSAGILHNFFKQAGFESAGAVEMDQNLITVFNDNHQHKETLTIHSKIEDIDPRDYPKGVDVVIAGIPCQSFSSGNTLLAQEIKKAKKSQEFDPNILAKRHESEALVYHVLRAIEEMNPKVVVVEEVVPFSETSASILLRTVLRQRGYILSEAISESSHTKRKRWALVAHMDHAVDLTNLDVSDGKTLGDILTTKPEERKWFKLEESKRLTRAKATIGLRVHTLSELKSNTFTTHGTRSTEPAIFNPETGLYSEFTNKDIMEIHGVKNYKLPETKTLGRKILGLGVADMFQVIAHRVMNSLKEVKKPNIEYQEEATVQLELLLA